MRALSSVRLGEAAGAHEPLDLLHLALDLLFVAFERQLLCDLTIKVAPAFLDDAALATLPGAVQTALPSDALELVELLDIGHQRLDDGREQLVSPQLPSRADGSAAGWALFLVDPVVVLDASAAELVHALAHVEGVLVDAGAHGAKQRLLELLEGARAQVGVWLGIRYVL